MCFVLGDGPCFAGVIFYVLARNRYFISGVVVFYKFAIAVVFILRVAQLLKQLVALSIVWLPLCVHEEILFYII
jgi:hypothetical protein